ncbi:Guanine nucleotide-exchange factor SEC12 [Neolecta irregularis DAH-3]|uniref:Guanine nucleotide-exchange factor SEC12 n=1 Tax=Neolecta irregularis (strain DAH-3) TaxID=1198029 RepID=A0A1U7LW72_NEOID|nr:Guanine nucleotide-exchange factor SEC12 [Neolecta irregularis DAH-3]|eukprot:OLL26930.1 Guanine nucleotide-exchange factor SEC12 [Neolecta irregularis DAH-3]
MLECNLSGFPAFAITFKSDSELFVTGGGGVNKSGISNKIIALRIDTDGLSEESEIDLSKEEEAPMAIAIGKNNTIISAIHQTKTANVSLRIFHKFQKKGKWVIEAKEQKDIYSTNAGEAYISVARYSRDKSSLALGSSDGRLTILNSAFKKIKSVKEDDEIYDIDFSADGKKVFYCTSKALHVLHNGSNKCVVVGGKLRAIRCFKDKVVCAMNERVGKKNFACLIEYDVSNGTLEQGRKIQLSKRLLAVSGMDLSDSGILALACGNLSIELWDVCTFKALSNIPDVHNIAITAISFSPSGKQLATTSVDSFVRVHDLDKVLKRSNLPMVVVLIILLLAILYQLWKS